MPRCEPHSNVVRFNSLSITPRAHGLPCRRLRLVTGAGSYQQCRSVERMTGRRVRKINVAPFDEVTTQRAGTRT